MNITEKVILIKAALEDKKGEYITILDISEISSIADYFVIASGSNYNQVQALSDNVKEELFKSEIEPKNIEGYNSGSWILMDYHDIIVHVFSKDDRNFYDLERIWRDAKDVTGEF